MLGSMGCVRPSNSFVHVLYPQATGLVLLTHEGTMNHSGYRLALRLPALCLLLAVVTAPALAKPQAASSGTPSSEITAKKSKQKPRKGGVAEDKSASADQSAASASPGAASAAAPAAAPKRASKPAPSGTPSDADIAAAKASGKVWVNLSSGVYHKGGRWYGKTKNGKFMTEAQAKADGYKGSKRD